jgi:hypothetical protein
MFMQDENGKGQCFGFLLYVEDMMVKKQIFAA